jgi:hypothetical protein
MGVDKVRRGGGGNGVWRAMIRGCGSCRWRGCCYLW